jgi:hypothetical protein
MSTAVKSKVLWGFRVQHAAWAQLALLVRSGGLPGLPATCTPQLQALDAKLEAECSSLAPASTACFTNAKNVGLFVNFQNKIVIGRRLKVREPFVPPRVR